LLASLVLGFALSAEATWLPVDPDNEFAQSLSVESKRASFAAGSETRSIFPMSRRGADTAQPLAARARNPIERPVARSGG
jgi:hypothetical protein